jgi:hypothetical protein
VSIAARNRDFSTSVVISKGLEINTHANAMNTQPYEYIQLWLVGYNEAPTMSGALPARQDVESSSMRPPPRPSSSQLPASTGSTPFSDWSPSQTPRQIAATPMLAGSSQAPAPATTSKVRLNEAEILVLVKLALQHWSIRERNCAEYLEQVEDDFLKAIARPFATSRKKIQDLIKKYRKLFQKQGSGTGVNSAGPLESEVGQVMKDLVAASDAEIAREKARDKQAAHRVKDKATSQMDRNNMMVRAMDKQRAPQLSGLSSDGDDEVDQTSEDEPSASVTDLLPVSSPASQSTISSRGRGSSHGRSRNNAQGKKRARGYDLEALVAGMEAERELRRQELQRQIERDRDERQHQIERDREDREERERLRREEREERVKREEREREDRLAALEERRAYLEVIRLITVIFNDVRRH